MGDVLVNCLPMAPEASKAEPAAPVVFSPAGSILGFEVSWRELVNSVSPAALRRVSKKGVLNQRV